MRGRWLVPALVLTLSACGSGSPAAELRGDVEAVTLAANDGSAGGVRNAVEQLLATIRAQVAGGELDRAEGERLRAIALRIEAQAGLLDKPEPSPSPVEAATEEPSPEPTPEQTKEPTPEPSPTPEAPSPEPSPQQEPPAPAPSELLPPVQESPPTAQSQAGPSASAQPTPA